MVGVPLISIVVTSFNYERFVGTAIASALAQTYAPVEVIVVDDGSTDGSREVIAAFGDKVRAIFQVNAGETAATNAGFAAARGDIVLFMDSDDALRPDAAAAAAAAIAPGVAAVQWQMQAIDADGRPFGGVFPKFHSGRSPAQIREESFRCGLYACAPSSGCAYSRRFLERIMPLPTDIFQHGPDGPINAVAPLYGDVVTIGRPLSFYRIHGENMWAQRELRPDDFSRYIDWDERRVGYFLQHARALGIAVPDKPLERAFFHLQYRMASLKLRPDDHPVPNDTPWRFFWRAARAAGATSRESRSARLVALVWLASLAMAPHGLAERLVTLRFIGGKRPKLLSAAMRMLGVAERSETTAVSNLSAFLLAMPHAMWIAGAGIF